MIKKAITFAAFASVSLAGCSAAPSVVENSITAAESATEQPIAEKTSITVYSGRKESLVQAVIDQFTTDTGITVEVRYGKSAEMAAQLLEEGDNSPADVFFSQDAGALGAVGKAGMFIEMPSEILGLVPSEYSAADGKWVGVSGRARVIVYDPDKVSEVPASVFDLARPEWQGRIGIAPTNASFQAFVTAMRILHGENKTLEWLKAMKANAVMYPKNSAILQAVEDKDIDAGLINHYYWFAKGKDIGVENMTSKLGQFQSKDVGNLINSAGVGIISDSSAAKSFVEYLLSKTGQQYFVGETSEYPLIPGVVAGVELTPMDQIPAPEIDLSDLDSLEETLDMIRESGLI
ncbi:MAG: iron(III) transport system substrate-binding protein [Aquiluna sp.]|jgi:iron(III) transport system substrate-binding protein|tara:strand:+ start:286 stop:1329 length:1044 start_codon:yes stop_codon:yes gene_type:complete